MILCCLSDFFFFFFKQKTAYEMRISDWSSDVCSSDLWQSATLLLGGRAPSGCVRRHAYQRLLPRRAQARLASVMIEDPQRAHRKGPAAPQHLADRSHEWAKGRRQQVQLEFDREHVAGVIEQAVRSEERREGEGW